MIRLISILLLVFTTMPYAFGALVDFDRQEFETQNALAKSNPGFESGKVQWVASPAMTISTSSQLVPNSKQYALWDSTSAGQTTCTASVTLPRTGNCEGTLWVATPSGTATHLLVANDGTNDISPPNSTIISTVNATKQTTGIFPCPSSGTVRMCLRSVAANEPSISFDNARLGESLRFGTAIRPPTVQRLTSGTGATYTRPAGVTYIRVKFVGGGGGGAASGTTPGGAATSGTATTFGTSLLSAPGGGNGLQSTHGIAGAAPTINSPAIAILSRAGTCPGGAQYARTGQDLGGTNGGSSPFLNAGTGGTPQSGTAGGNAAANSGSGGGGAGFVNQTAAYTGNGGCSGSYGEAQIDAPAATYLYTIGGGGTGGTLGTGGAAGGNGGTGYIEVTEYYDGITAITANQQQAPTVQKFTSGSGTYTTPAGVTYIEVKAVGGGGGGGSSGTAGFNTGISGGTTTWGSYVTLTGGGGGAVSGSATGGAATFGSPAIGSSWAGGTGQGAQYNNLADGQNGGQGGSSIFGGAGAGNSYGAAGSSAQANTGSGGGGAGANAAVAGSYTGGGGGAGAAAFFKVVAPPTSISYAIGAGGAGGGAGTNGFAGGAGAAGYIEVTEYYGYSTALFANGVRTVDNPGTTTINTVVAKTTTYTASINEETILLSASGGAWTLSLPAAASVKGKKYNLHVDVSSTNAITIDPSGAETICEGRSTVAMVGLGDSMEIQSDGSKWVGLNGSCYRTEAGRIANPCTANPCTGLTSTRQSISSVTRNSTGNYVANFTSGVFSAANCRANGGANVATFILTYGETASQFNMLSYASSTLTDNDFGWTCSGPR